MEITLICLLVRTRHTHGSEREKGDDTGKHVEQFKCDWRPLQEQRRLKIKQGNSELSSRGGGENLYFIWNDMFYLPPFFPPKENHLLFQVTAFHQPNLNRAFYISCLTQRTQSCRWVGPREGHPRLEKRLLTPHMFLGNLEKCQNLDLIWPWVNAQELVRKVFSPDPEEHVKCGCVKGLISH